MTKPRPTGSQDDLPEELQPRRDPVESAMRARKREGPRKQLMFAPLPPTPPRSRKGPTLEDMGLSSRRSRIMLQATLNLDRSIAPISPNSTGSPTSSPVPPPSIPEGSISQDARPERLPELVMRRSVVLKSTSINLDRGILPDDNSDDSGSRSEYEANAPPPVPPATMVEARTKDGWKAATVTKVNEDGTFEITFQETGNVGRRWRSTNIRPMPAPDHEMVTQETSRVQFAQEWLEPKPGHGQPAESGASDGESDPEARRPVLGLMSARQPSDDLYEKSPLNLITCDGETCEAIPLVNNEIRQKTLSSSETMMKWAHKPRRVLMVKKPDPSLIPQVHGIASWLKEKHGIVTVVEGAVKEELDNRYEAISPDDPGKGVDFIICIGGDGTLLWISHLFSRPNQAMPPVCSFAGGSLGFLTPFDIDNAKNVLKQLLKFRRPTLISLRTRLVGQVVRLRDGKESRDPLEGRQVLNEVLVDRGQSSGLCKTLLYVDNQLVTVVQADGLIISTPTGSTAYSMSAGGAMVAPAVPCILVTPICPHTLSFRPIIVPDSSTVKVEVPMSARCLPSISFDGKNRVELQRGDSIEIRTSDTPIPTIKMHEYQHEWFSAIQEKLMWNVRVQQKSMTPKL